MKRNKTDNTVLLNKLSTASWECFRTPLLPEMWKILNPFEVMKHMVVFESSAKSDIMSLDAGVRMAGLPGKPHGAIDKSHQSSGTLQIIFIVFVGDKNFRTANLDYLWIFCLRLARFQVNFRRSVMRIGPTNMFLIAGMQLCNCGMVF